MSERYARTVYTLLMSLVVSSTISLVMTLINIGLAPGFVGAWFSSLALGVVIAFPVSLAAERPLRAAVERITIDDRR